MISTGIYFVIGLAYGIWFLGIYKRSWSITKLGCFFLFGISLYIFQNGIDIFSNKDLQVVVFSSVTFALAAYTSYKVSEELFDI